MARRSVDLSAVLTALAPPALAVDHAARIVALNPACEALLGPGLEDQHYSRAIRAPALMAAMEATLAGHPPTDPVRWRPAGTQSSIEVSFGILGQGAERIALILFSDRTPAEQAEAMRRDFVANVSHELRTPLTSLLGFVETLQGPARDDGAARARFLTIMADEAHRMTRLVDDLLSLSRVEESERLRPSDPVDPGALLSAVREGLALQAQAAGVRLAPVADSASTSVPGDSDQLRQVMANLIENAIKYAGSGATVSLGVSGPAHDPVLRGMAVTVRVADDGPGMDPVHVPRLTERFYRVDDHRSREMGGTGLGLAIVKHIVSRHRGRLQIDTAPGEGARFSVILPV